MNQTNAVSSATPTHREITMQSALASISAVPQVANDRASRIQLVTRRQVLAYVPPTELRASQVASVARREIEWFFTSEGTGRDSEVARTHIAAWISDLTQVEQETLALYYDPLPCPRWLEGAVEDPWIRRHVERRAEWHFDTALSAYAAARGRVPAALPSSATRAR